MSEYSIDFQIRMDYIDADQRKALYDELRANLMLYEIGQKNNVECQQEFLFFHWLHKNAEDVDFSFQNWLYKVMDRYPTISFFAYKMTYCSSTDPSVELYVKYHDYGDMNYDYFGYDYDFDTLYKRNKRYQNDIDLQYSQPLVLCKEHKYYALTRAELHHCLSLDENTYAQYTDEEIIDYVMSRYMFDAKKYEISRAEAVSLQKKRKPKTIHMLFEQPAFMDFLNTWGYKIKEEKELLDFIKREIPIDADKIMAFWLALLKQPNLFQDNVAMMDEVIFIPSTYFMREQIELFAKLFEDDEAIRFFFFDSPYMEGIQSNVLCYLVKKGYVDLYHHINQFGIQLCKQDKSYEYDERLSWYLYDCVRLLSKKEIKFTKKNFRAIKDNMEYLCDKIFLNDHFKDDLFVKTLKKYGCYLFELNGTQYCDYQRIRQECNVSDDLVMVYEKENSYDANAIRIDTTDGLKLGYVPKEINVELQGVSKYTCKLVRKFTSKKSNFIRVNITVLKQEK